jgi:hypothetical protein
MPISTREAAEALNDIAHAQQRASILRATSGVPRTSFFGVLYGSSDTH